MNSIVVGAYWGDEGKGKIVDLLASDADWVVRYNGGDNAGHTIIADSKKVVLHLLPSGVLQGKNVLIGPDVFFNPASFLKDLNHVKESGFEIKGKILIDGRANVIMPYHVMLDRAEGGKIGSTKRGIGPAAKDKADRNANIRVSDMLVPHFFEKVKSIVEDKKEELVRKGILKKEKDAAKYAQRCCEVYSVYASRIKKYVENCCYVLNDQIRRGKKIIFEGAQGTLLDVVHGTKPFVTSSNTTAGGSAANTGIDVRSFKVIGIVKAYPTRVGEGPFPTELGSYEDVKKESRDYRLSFEDKKKIAEGDASLLGRMIRLDGGEYGATTGRPRRTGFPDFVALKYSAIVNGIDEWVITKIDVLSGKGFKAAVSYRKRSVVTQRFPINLEGWIPQYSGKEYFWPKMSEDERMKACSKGYDILPKGMKDYVRDVVKYTKVPVRMISIGPEREMTVIRNVLKKTKEYLK